MTKISFQFYFLLFSSGELCTPSKVTKTDETAASEVQSYQPAGTATYDPSAYTAVSAYTPSTPYTNSYTTAAAVAATAAAYGYASPAQTQWPGYTAATPVSDTNENISHNDIIMMVCLCGG